MKSLIIDAGHGGTDSGAFAHATKEKDWNLKMSLYQHRRLKELGATVALTRSTDQTLSPNDRTNRIKNKYDICISNHFNAFNGTARGIETIHSISHSNKLATDIALAIKEATGLPFRRVFSRKNEQGTDWYFMHRLTGKTETIIIEYGFLDHAKDFNFYRSDDNFHKAAEAVIQALCPHLGIRYQTPNQGQAPLGEMKTLYRVQVGAFSKKENAERQLKLLKKAGFDAFIAQ